MIIDCHGHYTTAPTALRDYRAAQVEGLKEPGYEPFPADLGISDDEIRESLEGAQLKLQRERGTDLTVFSPRAAGMAHQDGNEPANRYWSEICNDMIHRAVTLYPDNFVGVCQLPQVPGLKPDNCIPELVRCVEELGFIGCNLNPDPTGGYWTDPPLFDRWWYPLYEKMCELDVPAMIHVSSSCNPHFHFTGAHYINGDTAAFMQLLTSDLFADFPSLKFIIPHGGGAAPFHWGRYRGLAQDMGRPPLDELAETPPFGRADRPLGMGEERRAGHAEGMREQQGGVEPGRAGRGRFHRRERPPRPGEEPARGRRRHHLRHSHLRRGHPSIPMAASWSAWYALMSGSMSGSRSP